MLKQLTKIAAPISVALAGALGWSNEHKRFLANDHKCEQCGTRLVSKWGRWETELYAADGRKLSLLANGVLRASSFGCPHCGHRWKKYDGAPDAGTAAETEEIVETERSEEFIGEDRRVIDNSRSSGTPTRTFSFSKEWSKTFHIEVERAKTNGVDLTLGEKDSAALRLSSEKTLRRAYTVSEDTKETSTEEVSCQVPAHRKLTVLVSWKRIWQHGFVQLSRGGVPVKIPFRIAVGVTFDQTQIEDGDDKASGPTPA
jgi:predicted RNA-binding Zn-ribbon protein involved in translation (DUF1610 family)